MPPKGLSPVSSPPSAGPSPTGEPPDVHSELDHPPKRPQLSPSEPFVKENQAQQALPIDFGNRGIPRDVIHTEKELGSNGSVPTYDTIPTGSAVPERADPKMRRRSMDDGIPLRRDSASLQRSVVSPIIEESLSTGSPTPRTHNLVLNDFQNGSQAASPASNKTIKGSGTPFTPGSRPLSTPAYPFPSMISNSTSPVAPPAFHKPFTALSPTIVPPWVRVSKGESRASNMTDHLNNPSIRAFMPMSDHRSSGIALDAGPNMYNIAIKLTLEPGLDFWWSQLSQILTTSFSAERISLAVPSDNTDIENVPWAQLATYNAERDGPALSVKDSTHGSLIDGIIDRSSASEHGAENLTSKSQKSTAVPTSSGISLTGRPRLESRHSFAGFPQSLQASSVTAPQSQVNTTQRPRVLRAGSHLSFRNGRPVVDDGRHVTELSVDTLRRHEISESLTSPPSDLYASSRAAPGKVLDPVQPLESETDPLLTSSGVIRILDRNRTVMLTREYVDKGGSTEKRVGGLRFAHDDGRRSWAAPGNQHASDTDLNEGSRKGHRSTLKSLNHRSSQTSGSSTNSSTTRSERNFEPQASGDVLYEDFEQISASPWSQSPAPSPAVQADPDRNPFFVDAVVDENAFAENPPPHDYAASSMIQAIGIDRASSVVHIPLIHPTISQYKRPARLRSERRKGHEKGVIDTQIPDLSFMLGNTGSVTSPKGGNRVPIAILSILSPIVPYPGDSMASLTSLAPSLATSFYNARQHSNLQKEVRRMSRRYQILRTRSGFHDPYQSRVTNNASTFFNHEYQENSLSPLTTGSVTSASEYSSMSMHSPHGTHAGPGSAAVTPGWSNQDIGTQNYDSRGNDGYFASKPSIKGDKDEGIMIPTKDGKSHKDYKQTNVQENSQITPPRRLQPKSELAEMTKQTTGVKIGMAKEGKSRRVGTGMFSGPKEPNQQYPNGDSTLQDPVKSGNRNEQSKNESSPINRQRELPEGPSAKVGNQTPHDGGHPRHKYKNLPGNMAEPTVPKTFLLKGATIASRPRRSSNDKSPPPPVEYMFKDPTPAMLRIMIDNGATQQFIAECERGEIVWANSKFQSYRSESADEIHRHPWNNIHYNDQKSFRKLWTKALQTGEQVSHQVRLRRFDGHYRWFHMRILPLRDKHGIIKHWHGQAMDIHDQHVAEVEAAREKMTAASESKYRSLANSNPHIIFAASIPRGMTFANTQWLSYSGQTLEEALGFGFLQHIHPDDINKCRFPELGMHLESVISKENLSPSTSRSRRNSESSSPSISEQSVATDQTVKGTGPQDSPPTEPQISNDVLQNLIKEGVVKCTRDGQGNLSITTEMRLRSKTNEYRWHLVQGSLIDSAAIGERGTQWFIACADITDQKHSQRQLKQACETLEKEMSRKMEYLSSMSHEIRTPLNGILGNLQFLTNSGLDEFQSDWTFGAQKAAEGMHKLINDFLDVSKAEAKMLKLFFDWFSVRAVIEEVVETLNAKAGQKGLELCYEVAELVPPLVKGDAGRIKQVLLNLVGNAIKFTQRGEIWVKCDIFDQQPPDKLELQWNEIYLRFAVKDTGSGFSAEEKKLLFKPYSQIDNSNTRGNGGTGLGLILCKNMVELHGGEIGASSIPGKGSVFSFFARFNIRESISHTERPYSTILADAPIPSPSPVIEDSEPQDGVPGAPRYPPLLRHESTSETAIHSSGSSGPPSHHDSLRSSASTVDNEIEKSKMQLTLLAPPESMPPPLETAASSLSIGSINTNLADGNVLSVESETYRPSMLSILIVCPQENTRRTTQDHIQRVLPKSIPSKVTAEGNVEASQTLISGADAVAFSHVVLQLSQSSEVLAFMDQILSSQPHAHTCIVIVTDQAQKAAITNGAPDLDYTQLAAEDRLRFVLKPARPHKFAKIFDPEQENAQSNDDKTREEAKEKQRIQKAAFKMFKEVLGNKGIRVLAVEDNKLNMEVCVERLVRRNYLD